MLQAALPQVGLPVPRLLAALRNVHSAAHHSTVARQTLALDNIPEAEPGGLLVELVHLLGLALVQEANPLLPLLPELRALLLHLLPQQGPPHRHLTQSGDYLPAVQCY